MANEASDGTIYDAVGPETAPAIILVHGLGLRRAMWQWTVPAIADGFRCVTYDLLWHGESPAPGMAPSLRVFSNQLQAVMQCAGIDRAAIVGFSLGGMIARRFAQDLPDRVGALAILNSPHRRSPEAQAAILARVAAAAGDGPSATVEAALQRWFTDEARTSRPDLMGLVRSWVLANDPTSYPAVYRVLAEGIDEIVEPDPPICCPALVLTGEGDHGNGPEMTQAIAAEIVGAETVILPTLRHMALAEDPGAVNGPLRAFLDRATARVP